MRSRPNPRGENQRPGCMSSSNISSFQLVGVQRTMGERHALYNFLIFTHLIVLTLTLPTSLVEEIKASEQRNNKGMLNLC